MCAAPNRTRAALILSAGRSARMGRDKAALPLDAERTFHARALELARIGVSEQRVLTVAASDQHRAGRVVVNPDPERGMFSSLQVGVLALLLSPPAPTSCLLLLIDHPLVRESTVERLWRALEDEAPATGGALVPLYEGQAGHPIILRRAALAAIAVAPAERRLDHLLAELGVHEVAVDDPGVVRNVNTPERYAEWVGAELLDADGR